MLEVIGRSDKARRFAYFALVLGFIFAMSWLAPDLLKAIADFMLAIHQIIKKQTPNTANIRGFSFQLRVLKENMREELQQNKIKNPLRKGVRNGNKCKSNYAWCDCVINYLVVLGGICVVRNPLGKGCVGVAKLIDNAKRKEQYSSRRSQKPFENG